MVVLHFYFLLDHLLVFLLTLLFLTFCFPVAALGGVAGHGNINPTDFFGGGGGSGGGAGHGNINPTDFFAGARSRPKIEILYPYNGQVLDSESVDIKIKLFGHDFQRDGAFSDYGDASDQQSPSPHGPNSASSSSSSLAQDINKGSGSVPYSSFSSNFHSSAICIGISNGSNYFEQCFFESSYLVFSVAGLIPGDQYSLRVVYYERGNAIAVSVRNFKVGFITMDLLSRSTANVDVDGNNINNNNDDGSGKKKLSIKSALQIAFQTQFRDAPAIDFGSSSLHQPSSQQSSLQQSRSPSSATTASTEMGGQGEASASPSFTPSSMSSSVTVVEAILSQVPGHPEALHYYSLLLLMQGDANLAKDMVSKAIKNINDKEPGGNENEIAPTLMVDTDSEEYKLAVIKEYSSSKDPRAIVDYLNTLGQCYRVLSKFDESEQTFLSALTLHNNYRQVNILSNNLNSYDENNHVAVNNSISFNLALLYKQFNYFEKAINVYSMILNSPQVDNNNEDDIIRHSSSISLCDLMSTFSSGKESLTCYQKASLNYPHDKLIWNELGVSYAKQGLYDEAIASFTTSANLNSTIASINIAHILEILGYYNDSYTRYKLILDSLNAFGNGMPSFHIKVRMAMVMPRILPNNATEVTSIRTRIDSELTMLLDSSLDKYNNDTTIIDNSQPLSFGYSMGYHFLFHNGFDFVSNKNFKMKLSLVYRRLCPSLTSGYYMDKFGQDDYNDYQRIANTMPIDDSRAAIGPGDASNKPHTAAHPPAGSERRTIHIGVISRYFYNHPIGITSLGLLNELAALAQKSSSGDDVKRGKNKFVVTVFTLNSIESVKYDPIWRHILSLKVNVVYLLQNIELSGNIIKAHKLDMLIYPEVNSDPLTYFLSHMDLSLEPSRTVTAVWWIFPETSGVSSLDYFMVPGGDEKLLSEPLSSSSSQFSSRESANGNSQKKDDSTTTTALERAFVDDINFSEKVVKLPALGATFSDILKLLDPAGLSNGGSGGMSGSGGDGSAASTPAPSILSSLVTNNNGGSTGVGGINLFGRNLLLERLKFTEKLKLPKLAHIYLLLAPLHYYHYDYDALIRLLLQRDKLGYVVVMDSSITRPSWQRMFSRRVVGELPMESQNRFLFYYPSSNENRLLFIAIAHVVLDFPVGLCMYCTMTALSLGTPVVSSLAPSLMAQNSGKSRSSNFKMGSLTLLLYQKLDPNVFVNIDDYWRQSIEQQQQQQQQASASEHVIMAGDSSKGKTNSSDFPCVDIDGDSNYDCASTKSVDNSSPPPSAQKTSGRDAIITEIVTSLIARSFEDMVINAIKIAHKPKLRDSISQFINERRDKLFVSTYPPSPPTPSSFSATSLGDLKDSINVYETLIPEMIDRKRREEAKH